MYVCRYVCTYVCMYVHIMCLIMYVHSSATFSHHRTQSPFITSTLSTECRSFFPQHNALSRFEGRRRFTGNDHSVLNKQLPTADRRWSFGIGVERVPNYYTGWIFRNDLRNGKRIVFGMWNVGGRCRSGSLGTAASELENYRSVVLGAQKVQRDKVGT